MIYFIQDDSLCHIKIGHTAGEALDRMRQLQTASPCGLVLLATMEGGKQKEAELHRQFSSSRVQGEWFKPTPNLILYILKIARSPGATRDVPVPVPNLGPRIPVESFNENMAIRHPVYGFGKIIGMSTNGNGLPVVRIRFQSAGERSFLSDKVALFSV